MNTIDNTVLTNLNDNTSVSFSNITDVRINDNVSFSYEPADEAIELSDSVYYTKSDKMKETKISFNARLDEENDYIFKRFINKPNANLRLDVTINGNRFYIFVDKGIQTAEVNKRVLKIYNFELRCRSRAFIRTGYGTNASEPYDGGTYDDVQGGYDIVRYSDDETSSGAIDQWFSNMTDGNIYFTIQGVGTVVGVNIFVNDNVVNIGNIGVGNEFYYSNIPQQIAIKINGESRPDLLNVSNATNFTFDLTNFKNQIKVTGLDQATLYLWNVVNII